MPGLMDADTGLIENAYNTPYNKRPLKKDLENILGKEMRIANDANCFALSEAVDGAARGSRGGVRRDSRHRRGRRHRGRSAARSTAGMASPANGAIRRCRG